MVRVAAPLPLALALAGLVFAPGCEKKSDSETKIPGQEGGLIGNPTVNLFGFEESQIHWMHYNVQRRGRVLLARFDPADPEHMELLDCVVSGNWEYQEAAGSHVEELRVRNQGELHARVPLGVARFSSYVSAGSELAFNYVTVGAYQLADEPQVDREDPDCSQATHYVASLSVGAFDFEEMRRVDTGIDAKVPGGAGGGGSLQRQVGAHHSTGDVEKCKQANDASCRTPMQMMLIPLKDRHWYSKDMPKRGVQEEHLELEEVDHVVEGTNSHSVSLHINQDAWSPGYYMALSLSKLLSFATYTIEETKYGLDGDAGCLFGGFLTAQAPLHFSRTLKEGREYAIFGSGTEDHDIDIRIYDGDGNVVAEDVHNDSQPVAIFRPTTTAHYKIVLSMAVADAATFGTLGVAVDNGFEVPASMMQQVFQNLLDKGIMLTNYFAENGRKGVVFLDSPGDWAMQATILQPKEAITQQGIEIPANRTAVFLAVGHDDNFDLDAQVEDQNGVQTKDVEKDGQPVVVLEPTSGGATVKFTVQLSEATEATLGTSLILLGAE